MTLNSRQKEQWAENETSVPKFYDSGWKEKPLVYTQFNCMWQALTYLTSLK